MNRKDFINVLQDLEQSDMCEHGRQFWPEVRAMCERNIAITLELTVNGFLIRVGNRYTIEQYFHNGLYMSASFTPHRGLITGPLYFQSKMEKVYDRVTSYLLCVAPY